MHPWQRLWFSTFPWFLIEMYWGFLGTYSLSYLIINNTMLIWCTFDNCCPNSSNFCCSGVFSVSVSIISSRILPVKERFFKLEILLIMAKGQRELTYCKTSVSCYLSLTTNIVGQSNAEIWLSTLIKCLTYKISWKAAN